MKICIFCSSSNSLSQHFYDEANNLAVLLAENNCDLVYGGGKIGIMGELSRKFKSLNRKVIGIIPERLNLSGIVSEIDDEIMVTPDMHSRKAKMFEISDAFIALPGGFGTLEELLEVITLKQLNYHHKPIIIINQSGFYDFLIKQFDVLFEEKFAKDSYKGLYYIASNQEEAVKYLFNYKYEISETKYL
ncbi:MAG: Rossman fold protein, TIGR00730 family [Bacteroidetes bacterium GWA2_31_9]|nr:MAG: Rossman fold protein, TIGR00730 family [Bacteroidetes bacterium GWA2_31_9]